VDVLFQDVAVAEPEGAVDEIDQERGKFGQAGEGLIAGSAVGVAVGGDDEGGGVGALFVATLSVGDSELHA
jgi:hypothetical protein